jgi:fimbrial isopeptide formation D2 family protein/LPXTG-motif cell wall-anchored protein
MSNSPTAAARARRTLAAAAALTLGVLGALAATPASAAPVPGPVTNTTGSLTIHKYAYPANGAQNPSGTGTNPTTSTIDGVVFQVCAINNVTSLADPSNAGWTQVNGLQNVAGAQTATALTGTTSGVDNTKNFPLGTCTSITTAGGGIATLSNMAIGAYLVRETSAPSNVITTSTPFVVTVPTAADSSAGSANTGLWEYNVNVYPKNAIGTTPQKTIGSQASNGYALGSQANFSISQLLPSLPTGQAYNKLIVSDTLPSNLTPTTSYVPVVTVGTTALASPGDFTYTWSGQTLTVTFTAQGLAKLTAGQTVTVGFQAAVTAAGAIDNTATVNLNDLKLDGTNSPTPTNTVTTRWGNLLGTKTDAGTPSHTLAGATFAVYETTTTTGTCTVPAGGVTGLTQVTQPNSTTPLTATSDANGAIAINGLWVGDTSSAANNVTNRCYILQETVAPAGYVLPAGNAALTAVNVRSGSTVTTPTFTVTNNQQLVPGLPLTGANGQLILTIIGIALMLLAAGGVLLVVGRRARSSEQH